MLFITYITKILHFLPGELSHNLALKGLRLSHAIGLLGILIKSSNSQNEGLFDENLTKSGSLKNKLGLAAGLDKDGEYIDCLASLGFGFIEVGTVTPRPQKGNPKPRIFRDRQTKSLLNRLGFNNKGVDTLVANLEKRKSTLPLGISIGKNFDTPNDDASNDYLICLEKVYKYSSYIAVNISSPNTKNLRTLSSKEYLGSLLQSLKAKQIELTEMFGYKPLFIKVSPDEKTERLEEICEIILNNNIDGIICCNTTVKHNEKHGKGGLSGSPLTKKALGLISLLRKMVGNDFLLIASGGVMSSVDYQQRLDAGADLVQIYSGFIFEGPKLIKDINLASMQSNT